jgi:hypothetical protein
MQASTPDRTAKLTRDRQGEHELGRGSRTGPPATMHFVRLTFPAQIAGKRSCTSGLPWKIVEVAAGAPLLIDGVDVVACVMIDYGQTCTPRQICGSGTGDELFCGDDCGGGSCAACDASDPLIASFLLFGSPTPELARFRQAGKVSVPASPNVSGSCFGLAPSETRYVLACRPACGPAAWNVAVGGFQLAN